MELDTEIEWDYRTGLKWGSLQVKDRVSLYWNLD